MYRLIFAVLLLAFVACKNESATTATDTKGNATDRSPVTGTSGTGEPRNVATESAQSATQLGKSTGTMAVTGTEVVHGAKTETTATLATPTTTTASVETPTATSATVATTTSTETTKKKKH